ncbi:hypothetical protein NT6N_30770 [Oceaniferula spumae]|uniref:CcoQ/FixQ family Cbb3-type cytochrome c oxidase assembly chaperone n=1 Tax=Oceaniferula spumae TaxID=2979115 RepID=A0AAT9FPY1_9BACT
MTLIVAVMIWFLINYIVKNESQPFAQPGLTEEE